MLDTIRNSTFGHIVNHVSHQKLLPFKEETPGFVVPSKYLPASSQDKLKLPLGEQGAVELSVALDSSSSSSISDSGFFDADRLEKSAPNSDSSSRDSSSEYIIVDWYGDNDPENPKNWAVGKKVWLVLAMGLLTISIYMATSIYTPGVPDMMEELNTTQVKAILPLTAFVLGYGLGPMFLSPLSEHPPLGRTYIYIITLAIFCVLQIPTAMVDTVEKIIGLRLIAGLVASPALSTGGATLGDVFTPEKLYIGLLLWAISAFCGPAFGPLIGGVLTQLVGWRWTFWFLAIVSGVTLAILFVFLPETNSATLLHRRAARLRKLTNNNNIKSPYEIEKAQNNTKVKEVVIETLWRPIFLAFGEPMVFLLDLYCAFVYIIVNSWFEAFPLVFHEIYGFNTIESGIVYLSVIIGAVIGGCIYLPWVAHLNKDADDGIEKYLKPAMGGSFLLPIGLFIFSWGASTHTHWIAPCIGAMIFCVGAINIFQAIFNYLGRGFRRYMASVFAANCLVRSWAAGVFPVFVTPMYRNLALKDYPVGPGGSILGGISVLMIAIPFVIYRYGVPLRGRSKYAN